MVNSLRIALLFCFLMQFCYLYAAPYTGDIFNFKLPDGSTVSYKLFGDEYYADMESLDGYNLIDGNDGWLYYSKLSQDGKFFISTGIKYTGGPATHSEIKALPKGMRLLPEAVIQMSESRRIKLGNPSVQEYIKALEQEYEQIQRGEIRSTDTLFGLTVLIDFPDQKSSVARDEIEKFVNLQGYNGFSNNGSIYDYWYDVSGGKLKYKQVVTQFVTMSKNKSYYDNNGTAPISEMVNEIMATLQSQSFDFSKVTKNGTRFRAMNMMYAGTCASSWAKGLWPHMSSTSFSPSVGGVTGASYQMCDIKTQLSMGTFCHENGHLAAGFADLYPYSGSESTVGGYCLMCYGGSGTNPVPPNAYFRIKKGWEQTTDITTAAVGSVFTLQSNALQSLVFKNTADTNELFVIDARQKTGRNTRLSDAGGIVWWINKTGSNTTAGGKKLVTMKWADNNGSDAGNCYKQSGNKRINSTTTPNSNWFAGASTMDLYFMDNAGPTMRVGITDATKIAAPLMQPSLFFVLIKNDKLTFFLPHTMQGAVSLFNLQGKMVRAFGNGIYTTATPYVLPISGTAAGEYILHFKGTGFEAFSPVHIVK